MKRISFKARINFQSEGNCKLMPVDNTSHAFESSCVRFNRISFSKIFSRFKDDSVVKITIEGMQEKQE